MTNVDAQVLKLPLSQQIHKPIPQLLKLDTNGILQLLEIRSWQGMLCLEKHMKTTLERVVPPSVPIIGYFMPD